jgi:hypothetical protein
MSGISISLLLIVLVVLAVISYAIWSARKTADPDLTGKHGWLFLAGVGLFPMLAMAALKLEIFSGGNLDENPDACDLVHDRDHVRCVVQLRKKCARLSPVVHRVLGVSAGCLRVANDHCHCVYRFDLRWGCLARVSAHINKCRDMEPLCASLPTCCQHNGELKNRPTTAAMCL